MKQIPRYDDFARLERDLRALARDDETRRDLSSPKTASRAEPDEASDARKKPRIPCLHVALVGVAAADDDDLVMCDRASSDIVGDARERAAPRVRDASDLKSSTAAEYRPGSETGSGFPVRAIYYESTAEHHFARQAVRNGEWLRDAQVVASKRGESPRWRLEETSSFGSGEKSRPSVVMHDAAAFGQLSDAARLNEWLLTTAYDAFESVPGTSSVLRTIADANLGVHVLGVRTRERVLTPGTPLTAVGEVCLEPEPRRGSAAGNDDPGSRRRVRMRFRKPIARRSDATATANATDDDDDEKTKRAFTVTHKSFDEFVDDFGRASSFFRVLSLGCLCVGGVLFTVKLVRARLVRTREKRFRERLAEAEARSAASGQVSTLTPGETCVVCLTSRATACYKECGHLVCCETCAARMKRCPLCRRPSAWMKVYRAGG